MIEARALTKRYGDKTAVDDPSFTVRPRTAAAISALLGLLLIAPAIFGNLLGAWGKDLAKLLPSGGESFIHGYTAPNTLAPWSGLAVTVLWVVVMTVAAAIQLGRRDA
jgi:ABC-2 type transport system permease protein